MMHRRSLLTLIGLAPVVVVTPAMPAPATAAGSTSPAAIRYRAEFLYTFDEARKMLSDWPDECPPLTYAHASRFEPPREPSQ